MPTQKVVFYTDKPAEGNLFNDSIFGRRVCQKILDYLGVEGVMFLNAVPVAGFESGIDWDELGRQGVSCVVIYDCNDAGAYGVKLEAENAGLKAYEIHANMLYNLGNLLVDGREAVLNLNQLNQK